MSDEKDYADLVSTAESAVSNIKDPELRRVAFEKVLDDLLGKGKSVKAETSTKPRKKRAKVAVGSGGGSKTVVGPQSYIEELIAEEFFKIPKTIAAVREELANRGHHIPVTSLSGPLQKLCQKKRLRRQKTKSEDGKKATFTYANY